MKVRLTRPAADDFDLLTVAISEYDTGAALRLIDRFEARVVQLQGFPLSGRPGTEFPQPGIRVLPLDSWRIIYEVAGDVVLIRRIVHAARDLGSLEI